MEDIDGRPLSDPELVRLEDEISQPPHFAGTVPNSTFSISPVSQAASTVQESPNPSVAHSNSNDSGHPPAETPDVSPTPGLLPTSLASPALTHLSQQVRSFRIFLDICSGVSRPLSKALRALHADVISFDILLDNRMNLLTDDGYEALLKLCSSSAVAYASASPSFSPRDLAKIQESDVMLSRCIQCLALVHASGGHVHLEQPASAMSWLEPETQRFVKNIGTFCINLAACHFGCNWSKDWMFSSSYPPLQILGCVCEHPAGAHHPIAGHSNLAGDYFSRDTACYPEELASRFADCIAPLLTKNDHNISWDERHLTFPIKSVSDLPRSSEDGGGLFSEPDWSATGRSCPDSFKSLRQTWMRMIIEKRLDKKLLAFCQLGSSDPPFSAEELQPFHEVLHSFLQEQGFNPDWQIRAHQPMHLHVLQALSKIMQDEDSSLFDCLIRGVSTGFQHDIVPSRCFPINDHPSDSNEPLSVHMQNWQSAEDDPELTRELVQEEISKGWVYEFHGDISQAQLAFPVGVAVGKLGVATAEGRPPRLVVDNSICGLNSRCHMPERSTLPTAKDVIRSYPLRNTSKDVLGFSLDIKSAHKRIVVIDSEQGLIGFTMDGRLFFYRVCPFGAAFSAAWWSRLGGFILRCFHKLVWLAHVALLYCDDFFIYQDHQVLPCSAALLCIFCQLTKIPISWKKCELSGSLKWIGWNFHIKSGFLSIPDEKIQKVSASLRELAGNPRVSKKKLEKTIGICMWLTQLWPYMRIWLHYWYRDLYSIPASLFSVQLDNWQPVVAALNDDLVFSCKPAHTGIPEGGKLVSVGHTAVSTRAELSNLRLRDRIWLRIRDPHSTRRKLSDDSMRIVKLFQNWISILPPVKPLRPKGYWHWHAAADAMAAGGVSQIGGFVDDSSGRCMWFSEKFSLADFESVGLALKPDLQKNITCLETLAQMALLLITSKYFPGHRMPICLKSLSDNTGAEASSNKLFTMSKPLCFFLERLCLLSAQTNMEIDVGHIPGHDNVVADQLSRWDDTSPIPCGMVASNRVRMSIHELWTAHQSPILIPPNCHIPWSLPI